MLFRWLKGAERDEEQPSASAALQTLVRSSLRDADDATVMLVGAVAGLLACVAYADRAYREEEQLAVADALSRVHGLSAETMGAVAELLSSRIRELAHEPLHEYTRVLVSVADRNARLELLDVLMDVAAADLVVSMEETNLLRRVARLLGLSDHDYLSSQARHRERLSVLDVPGS